MVVARIISLNKKQVCFKCGTEVSYSKEYDCYHCKKCHIWLEPKCDDLFCMFCRKRPTRPKNETLDKSKLNKKAKSKKRRVIEWKV